MKETVQLPNEGRPPAGVSRRTYVDRTASELAARYASPEPLVPLLQNSQRTVRRAAAKALFVGDFEFDEDTVDALLSAIDDADQVVAVSAIRALGRKQVVSEKDEIAACLNFNNEKIAVAAMTALAEMGVDEVGPQLLEYFESESPVMIRGAANAVLLLNYAPAADALLETLDRWRTFANTGAGGRWLVALRPVIEAIGRLKVTAAIPLLTEMGRDQFGLRTDSLRALAEFGIDISSMALESYRNHPTESLRSLLPTDARLPTQRDKAFPETEYNERLLEGLGASFRAGSICGGMIVRLTGDHAVVQLDNGVTALLTTEEVTWRRIRSARDVLRRDEAVVVKVLKITDSGEVTVSLRQTKPDPFVDIQNRWRVGTVAHGEIVEVTNFGLFVALEPELHALLHRSKAGVSSGERLDDVFRVGQVVPVMIVTIDPDHRKIGLALVTDDSAVETESDYDA